MAQIAAIHALVESRFHSISGLSGGLAKRYGLAATRSLAAHEQSLTGNHDSEADPFCAPRNRLCTVGNVALRLEIGQQQLELF